MFESMIESRERNLEMFQSNFNPFNCIAKIGRNQLAWKKIKAKIHKTGNSSAVLSLVQIINNVLRQIVLSEAARP